MSETKLDSPLREYKYVFYAFACLVAMKPLGIDTTLPAFPSIADYLGVEIATVQFTLVSFLFGATLGQFLSGPLSDSMGRMRVGAIGSLLFCLASLAITATTDQTLLLIARAAQGFAAGSAGVVVSAIIAEQYSGKQAARTMASVTLVIMTVPLVAPLLGTYLVKLGGWRTIFYFLAAYGAAVFLLVRLNTPKQRLRPQEKQKKNIITGSATMLRNYAAVLAKPVGRLYILGMGLNLAVYTVFATSASFVYMSYFGVSLELFPFLLGINTIFLIIGNRLGVLLLRYFEPYQVCAIGSRIMWFFCSLLLITVIFFEPTLTIVVGLVILTAGSIPITGPIASSVYMQLYTKNAGTASASMGVSRALFGMLGGFIVTILHNGTLYPMAIIMFIVASLATLCFSRAAKALALIESAA